jgi:hypothetical protein
MRFLFRLVAIALAPPSALHATTRAPRASYRFRALARSPKEVPMSSSRMITSTLIALVLLLSVPPGHADDSHPKWCDLLSVGQPLHKAGGGATRTPGARVVFLEPTDFVRQVEAGQRPTEGRIVLAAEKNSPAARAFALVGLSELTFKAPNGRVFSLSEVRLERRSAASQGGDGDKDYFEVMSWSW